MATGYAYIIPASWAALLLVWGLSALFVKRDAPGVGDVAGWRRFLVLRFALGLLILMLVLRFGRGAHPVAALLFRGAFTLPPALGWTAAALTACGISFAIWARIYLGRNWSPRPTLKEEHELVTTGPYAFVRHPIYTGLTLAMFGTALIGAILGAVMFVILIGTFVVRIGKEEQLMRERFPAQYPAYQQHTKRLVPFVW